MQTVLCFHQHHHSADVSSILRNYNSLIICLLSCINQTITCSLCIRGTFLCHSLCSTVNVLAMHAAPLPSACLGQLAAINCDADGQSCDYEASFAVQPDDSITITMSAITAANTWVGIGVSDDQMMVSVVCYHMHGLRNICGQYNNYVRFLHLPCI